MPKKNDTGESTQGPTDADYPLLRALLRDRGLTFLPLYSTADVARIFVVSQRAILYLIASGKLPARDLPGRARFLPQDLEDYLKNSKMASR